MSRIKIDGEYKVGTLLKRIGYLSEIQLQELQSKSGYIKRLKLIEQWDNALLTLQDLGWQISFESVTYPESIQPVWVLPENKNTEGPRRPKGWLNIWLEAKVIIKPTEKIQEKLEAINAPALPVSKPKSDSEPNLKTVLTESEYSHPNKQKTISVEDSQKLIPGWALEEALKLRGWTKSHLAERLGLQKSLPGKWINGSRKIQPLHLKQLWEWLAPELNQIMSG